MPPSGTFTWVDSITNFPEPVTTRKETKTVRFPPEDQEAFVVGIVPCRDDIDEQGKEQMWLTSKEFLKSRITAKLLVRSIRQLDHGQPVIETDHSYCSAKISLQADLSEQDFQDLLSNPSKLSRGAEKFAKRSMTGRGFERHISPTQKEERVASAALLRRHVAQMSQENVPADEIASFYRQMSRVFTLLSRINGHADEQAARDVCAASVPAVQTNKWEVPSDEKTRNFASCSGPSRVLPRQVQQRSIVDTTVLSIQ